ncbi:MAG: filamentous hemagglutinin N-terminal domain-containing protein, partial [Cyanobacteria bacterium P01_F01_bin.143]
TQVNLIDGQQKITGGMESGQNLFHSFEEFSPNIDITHFDNSSNIQNIFTRVTGDSTSFINGLISTNDNASLFILNPAGIILGNSAQLDIGGSFIATTAESIIFADGTNFNTQIDQMPPLLTVSIPSGLQYGDAPGSISSNNTETVNLSLSPENTIAFLGGKIELQNIFIDAFSGNVEIGSVAEGEIISLSLINQRWIFDYSYDAAFSDINISQPFQINTSGKLGSVNLRGENITLDSTIIFNSTTENFQETEENSSRSGISLLANNNINLDKILLSTQVPESEQNNPPITERGADIKIVAEGMINVRGSGLSTSTFNQGDGGNIIIQAGEYLELSGFSSTDFPTLIATGVGENSSGNGGNIEIKTDRLVIMDDAAINSSTFGAGKAGNIIVQAKESILISGSSFNQDFQQFSPRSGLFAVSGGQATNAGASGKVTINTSQLLIEDGGAISVSNFGTGNAGNIEINVEELLLNNDSQIISTRASGDEGSITISGNEIVLRDSSTIATTATGNGNGGNITFNADNIVLFDESTINANAFEGSGGKITITTQGLFTENNPANVITASSEVKGLDGTVEINTPDTNSKLETTEQRQSPLAAEESIYTGCSLGTDFSANKFSYIGRGGMRKGPFDSLESQEVIADLGLEESIQSTAELSANHRLNNDQIDKTSQSITEATTWIINDQGKVELIAQAPNHASSSGCLFK